MLTEKPVSQCLELCEVDDFASFWASYPRRNDKKGAQKRWLKIRPDDRHLAIGVATIMARLVADGIGPEPQFIPYASTWLNHERWNDWREGVPAEWCPINGNGKAAAARQEHDAFLRQFAAERGLDYDPEEESCI